MLAHKYQLEAIGTLWSIETVKEMSRAEKQDIDEQIQLFDRIYSRFREDSLVKRIQSKAPGTFMFPNSITHLYKTYISLEKTTDGRINPLVGMSLEQLGYDAAYSLKPKTTRSVVPPSFTNTVQLTGTNLTFKEPVLLDIGAIGKGYLVDVLSSRIAKRHAEYVVDGSGDMAVKTKTPEVIGLEHPLDSNKVIGAVRLSAGSLCGSGVNRRTWGDELHHVLDATTGRPLRGGVIATWAIAGNTMLADALATALFFAPYDKLSREFGNFHYVTMDTSGHVAHNIHQIGEIYA